MRGDVVEIFPSSSNHTAIRVEYFGDEIDRICEVDTVTGNVTATLQHAAIFPASHYVVSGEHVEQAISEIETELQERVAYFEANHRLIEAQRIAQRTHYDMEMLREIGFCSGIENYSRKVCAACLLAYHKKSDISLSYFYKGIPEICL
jgi:excinuclease ABC subunit B